MTLRTSSPHAKVPEPSPNKFTSPRRTKEEETNYVPSPIQLTSIRDLPPSHNNSTVSLHDLLRDPLLKECWNFNYLFDIDFVLSHLDSDVRHLVSLKIVHGFWKAEDANRIALASVAAQHANVELISAYMPNLFGTHHSKMMVLIRHDDSAQVVIHTANMIARDWVNMTQGVWRSPVLRLLPQSLTQDDNDPDAGNHPIGSGRRFKRDLLVYLSAYGSRLRGLTTQLRNYDFSPIRAAFLASAPSRQKLPNAQPSSRTSFGWPGLCEILSAVPVAERKQNTSPPSVVVQISSIASLGAERTWLDNFHAVLSTSANSARRPATPFTKAKDKQAKDHPQLDLHIIFPTAPEIRTSLDGYASGASIHTKLASPAQQKQLLYLRPHLRHWNPDPDLSPSSTSTSTSYAPPNPNTSKQPPQTHTEATESRVSLRAPAAPHIKTYTRFADAHMCDVTWAMLTSANLSKQAWGEMAKQGTGEVWVQSYEVGVVVWPGLFAEGGDGTGDGEEEGECIMVPVFGRDEPRGEDVRADEGGDERRRTVVGWRCPYDVPLRVYGPDVLPWCATAADAEEDWMGRAWKGYGA